MDGIHRAIVDITSHSSSIKRYLHAKICILVTHQIQFLRDATKILVLKNVRCGSETVMYLWEGVL